MHDSQHRHFAGLDVIRSIACLVVLESHLLGESVQKFLPLPQSLARVFQFFFVNAEGGVRVFFALSGFLITHLVLEERRLHGRLDFKVFWLRRALRIWPLYAVVLVLGFVVFPRLGFVPVERFWPFAIFGGNFEVLDATRTAEPSVIVAPTWSISIEEQFYVVWPVLLSAFHVRGRALWATVILFFGAAAGFAFLGGEALVFHTLPNLLPLAIGSAAAISLSRPEWLVLTRNRVVLTFLLLCTASLLHGREGVWFAFASSLLISVVVALWCVVAVNETSEPTHFATRLLMRLAKYTYALYLLQTTVGLTVRVIAHSYGITDGSALTIPLGVLQIVLAVALAIATHFALERPFLKLRPNHGR
ncbi:MAG: acyltransferase [Archangium sp.]